MKSSIFFVAICIFWSCSGRNSGNNDTPVSLETNKSVSVFKRVPDDLVENIYDELVAETPALKELENQIEDANDRKNDSLSDYQKFTYKNEQYYTSADHHAGGISDSVLKERIKMLINNSQGNYKNKAAGIDDLVKQLDKKQTTLSDYHQVLKLTRTLPVIEKFQKTNLPSKRPIEAMVGDYNKLIQKADSLGRK